MRNVILVTSVFTGLLLSLTTMGCGTMAKAPTPITRYVVNYPVSPITFEKKLPVVIRLEHFSSAPGYATNHMIFSDQLFQRKAYRYHQWISPPAEMVVHALVKDFKASRAFSAVTLPGERLAASHLLSGSITDFHEKIDVNRRRQVILGVSVLMFTHSNTHLNRSVVLEKQYKTEVDCQGSDAAAFAVAMNRAVQILSREILADLYAAIATQLEDKQRSGRAGGSIPNS